MSILSVKNLSKSFGKLEVLNDISFNVEQGEVISIIGPSGSGKSTLLRCINQFEKIDSGECEICGITMTRNDENGKAVYADNKTLHDIRLKIGLVFQNYALFPSMNVAKNVGYGLKMHKVPQPEIDERVNEALELVKLGGYNSRRVTQLSGGEQQRVALARALVTKPNILLLDEPLSALDRKVRAEMQYEIRNLQRQIGTTTVFVTHDQEEALTMSDQIILLHDGQIEQQGDPFTIYSQPASVFASDFLGKANLLSGVLACEDGVWCVCSENVRIPVNHVGGREGDTVKTAVRGEYFEFCTPETEGANPFHLEKKIFTGLSWKLIGTLGTQPLDISALGTHAGTLSEGDNLFVRIRPENVVYYNNN